MIYGVRHVGAKLRFALYVDCNTTRAVGISITINHVRDRMRLDLLIKFYRWDHQEGRKMTSKEFIDGIQLQKWIPPFHYGNNGRSIIDAHGKKICSFFNNSSAEAFLHLTICEHLRREAGTGDDGREK
jgi:hypothetical protein